MSYETSQTQAAHETEYQLSSGTGAHDKVQPAEAEATEALIADALPQEEACPVVETDEAAEPETAEPETVAPETVAPGTVVPGTVAPETVEPETVEPETVESEITASETVESETAEPEAVVPERVAIGTVASDTVEPKTVELETVEPEKAASETVEPNTAAPEEVDGKGGTTAVQPSQQPVAGADTTSEADLHSAETARMLLDIMAMPSGAVQPQERALAGDTLLRLVSRMPVASLVALCNRLCIMESPPPLLVRRLIQHENMDVSGPLLEKCPAISDQDLMTMINMGDVVALRLIARRRHLSPALTDALIGHGDASVMLTVVRNPGAALSHEAFNVLAETAKSRISLQAPLATRADTPAPIAFELFWSLPPQLRRYVLSRFLTESATLDRILKIAHALEESNGGEAGGNPKIAVKAEIEELVTSMADGKTTEASQKLAALAGIGAVNAKRIITDSEGEPLTVAMKAIGLSRTQFAAVAETLRDAPAAQLRANRSLGELKNLFDSLSFTKARVLLTYWDWAVEQSGPYSGKAV